MIMSSMASCLSQRSAQTVLQGNRSLKVALTEWYTVDCYGNCFQMGYARVATLVSF